ncbi:MAG: methionine--tRNA ligase, partial [Verrucomicrobiota bacterium]
MTRDKTFYITTPIYYVNDKPHIGHAYTTLLADVLARYSRLLEQPTFFLTGTDEHGQKVFEAARKNNLSPQEQCDSTVVRFQQLWERLETTHDDFIRTTEERHRKVVKEVLKRLYEEGEIYASDYEGWYCVGCERFFTEKDLAEEGQCPECERSVEKLVEKNYFFRMSKYQDWLINYIKDHPHFIQPEHRRQETLGFLKQPLGDLCISRPVERMNWGIELPFDENYVTYVWFDALLNYVTGIGYLSDPEKFHKWWPATYHLIGKDILTTHTVYWPTMLKAMGLEMPETVFAHGWWLVGRDKMSKSRGNVVSPMDVIDLYGVDAFRYFIMAEMTLGQDASFTEEIFINRYNAELANDLGNLVSRVLKMVKRNLNNTIPHPPQEAGSDNADELIATTLSAVKDMEEHIRNMQIDKGIAEVMNAVRACNRYFENNAPWQLAKEGEIDALKRVLYNAAECLRIVSGLLYPVMPAKMATLRRALGLTEEEIKPKIEKLADWGELKGGTEVQDIKSLFPRITQPESEAEQKSAESKKAEKPMAAASQTGKSGETASVDDLKNLKLKTAAIVSAE